MRDVELDVERTLFDLEGTSPERPRVGLYAKLIWETLAEDQKWCKTKAEEEEERRQAELEAAEAQRLAEAERLKAEAVEAYKAQLAADAEKVRQTGGESK